MGRNDGFLEDDTNHYKEAELDDMDKNEDLEDDTANYEEEIHTENNIDSKVETEYDAEDNNATHRHDYSEEQGNIEEAEDMDASDGFSEYSLLQEDFEIEDTNKNANVTDATLNNVGQLDAEVEVDDHDDDENDDNDDGDDDDE